MKFFKKKNLLNVLYAVLIALPLFSILGRVLYTQWNQNAKDSYYGDTINQVEYTQLTSVNDIKIHETYNGAFEFTTQTNLTSGRFAVSNVKNLTTNYSSNIDATTITEFYIAYNGTLNSNVFTLYRGDLATVYINLAQYYINFDFYLDSYISLVNWDTFYVYLNHIKYNPSSFLDNAFDYSISQFVSENDFGKLNFFTWFSDLFLSNNSVNNLYIHFVNWYLNYTLYVSLGYILWLVLMWFVSFVRRLLEKTSTYETGGF